MDYLIQQSGLNKLLSMSSTYRLFKNTGWGIIAKTTARISHALIAIFISRFIGVTATGAYNIGLTYLTIGLSFSIWGFDQNLILEVSKNPQKIFKFFGNLLIIQTLFGILTYIPLLIISLYSPYTPQTRLLVQILSLSVISESVSTICQSVFIAFEEFKKISLVNTLVALIKVILLSILIFFNKDLILIAWIFTGISYLSMLVFLVLTRKYLPGPGFPFDWHFGISQLKISSIFFIISILYSLDSRIDILILSFLSNDYNLGLYSAALGIVAFFYLLPQAFRDAIFPVLSRLHFSDKKSAEKLYQFSTKYVLLLTLPIAAFMCSFAQEIILFVYNEPFLDATILLRISIWIFPVFALMVLNNRVLIIDQKGKIAAKVLAISPILIITLNLMFYPELGITISSVIRVISSLLVTIFLIILVKQKLYKPNILKYFLQLAIALLIMILSLHLLKPLSLILSLVIGFCLYSGILFILKVFNHDELHYWQTIFIQIKNKFNKG